MLLELEYQTQLRGLEELKRVKNGGVYRSGSCSSTSTRESSCSSRMAVMSLRAADHRSKGSPSPASTSLCIASELISLSSQAQSVQKRQVIKRVWHLPFG